MSYENGISAMNLEMPDKIPRTEYSAHSHWDLVQKITGIKVSSASPENVKANASAEFIRLWDYGLEDVFELDFQEPYGTRPHKELVEAFNSNYQKYVPPIHPL